MTKYLLVKVDTNDADYIEQLVPITEAQLVTLLPLLEAIKQFKPYKAKAFSGSKWKHDSNFPYGETCREDLGEKTVEELYADHPEALELFIDEFLPTDEGGSCHKIVSVRTLLVAQDEKII